MSTLSVNRPASHGTLAVNRKGVLVVGLGECSPDGTLAAPQNQIVAQASFARQSITARSMGSNRRAATNPWDLQRRSFFVNAKPSWPGTKSGVMLLLIPHFIPSGCGLMCGEREYPNKFAESCDTFSLIFAVPKKR